MINKRQFQLYCLKKYYIISSLILINNMMIKNKSVLQFITFADLMFEKLS